MWDVKKSHIFWERKKITVSYIWGFGFTNFDLLRDFFRMNPLIGFFSFIFCLLNAGSFVHVSSTARRFDQENIAVAVAVATINNNWNRKYVNLTIWFKELNLQISTWITLISLGFLWYIYIKTNLFFFHE